MLIRDYAYIMVITVTFGFCEDLSDTRQWIDYCAYEGHHAVSPVLVQVLNYNPLSVYPG